MSTVAAMLILWIFISETMSMSWSSEIHSIFKTKVTRGLKEISTSSNLTESIGNGTKLAVEQCSKAFYYERWNCPEAAFSTRYKHPFSKEIAYTQAITAAGIVYAVTKSCSEGKIAGCGCDPERSTPGNATIVSIKLLETANEIDWTWGRCSDNTEFAETVTKKFLSSTEEGNDAQAHCTSHNHNIGRQIVRDTMQKRCICHGPFLKCAVQTCVMQLAPFEDIAQALKQYYHMAAQIDYEHSWYGNNARFSVSNVRMKRDNPNVLWYVEDSPDYCRADRSMGLSGMKGRPCSKYSNATDPTERRSCRNLCRTCGYKAKRSTKKVKRQCNCSFHFCCEVRCEICTETIDTYYCE